MEKLSTAASDTESGAQGLREETSGYDPSCREVAGCCSKRCGAIFFGATIAAAIIAALAALFVVLTKEALPLWLRQTIAALIGNVKMTHTIT